MNKKYLAVGLVSFMLLGLASAMLVTYLSNTVSFQANSNSPIMTKFTNAQTTSFNQSVSYTDNSATATIFGGESIILDVDLKNQANSSITNVLEEVKFDSTNISVNDFTVDYSDTNGTSSVALCTDGTSVYAYVGSPSFSMSSGEDKPHTLTVNMAQNSIGTYTANSKVVDASARVC